MDKKRDFVHYVRLHVIRNATNICFKKKSKSACLHAGLVPLQVRSSKRNYTSRKQVSLTGIKSPFSVKEVVV